MFGKKASQEKLASRISTVLDITLNDNDGLPNLVCKVQAGVESLDYCDDGPCGHGKWIKDQETLMSHNTEESENSPESPYFGEIKHMCEQCVPGAPPFFVCQAQGYSNTSVKKMKYRDSTTEMKLRE